MSVRRIAATSLAAIVALAGAGPASASSLVELSGDGVTYASSLDRALFPGSIRLVPLAQESAVFWVRNGAPEAAYLRLTLENPTWSDAAFAAALAVSARAQETSGAAVAPSASGPCRILLDGIRLDAGESIAVTATLTLADLDGTSGQDAAAGMQLGVTLTQAVGLAPGASCATPSALVPVVGAAKPRLAQALLPPGWNQFGLGLQWTWVALLLGGAVFFALRRFRRHRAGEQP
jgi:hypothetical protein